jgi:hypothetical protein
LLYLLNTLGNYEHLPWVTGVTEAEGLYPAGTFVNRDEELKHLDRDFEKLAPFLLDFNLTVSADEMSNVLSLIRTEYFNDRTIDRSEVKSIIKVCIKVINGIIMLGTHSQKFI